MVVGSIIYRDDHEEADMGYRRFNQQTIRLRTSDCRSCGYCGSENAEVVRGILEAEQWRPAGSFSDEIYRANGFNK